MSGFNRDIIFKGDGSSKNFIDVLPKDLTIRKEVPLSMMEPFMGYSQKTLFREVTINKYVPNEETLSFLNSPIKEVADLHVLYKEIKKAIFNTWDSSKLHIIGHSSGYDSRIISTAIKELKEEHGETWAGEIICVEVYGETKEFKELMAVQGFKNIAYNENSSPNQHHAYSFEFSTFWQKFNGLVSFPVNLWYDPYKDLYEKGLVPKEGIQGYTGYGANESMEIALKKIGFAEYYRWHHYLQLQNFKLWGDNWVHPYWQWNVQQALRGCNKWNRGKTRLAKLLCDAVVPNLNSIVQVTSKEVAKRGYRTLDNSIMKQIVNSYDKSWYGKNVKIQFRNDMSDYKPWWFHYCAASLCEYLLVNGYKISFV